MVRLEQCLHWICLGRSENDERFVPSFRGLGRIGSRNDGLPSAAFCGSKGVATGVIFATVSIRLMGNDSNPAEKHMEASFSNKLRLVDMVCM
jgi:hypothetical protein